MNKIITWKFSIHIEKDNSNFGLSYINGILHIIDTHISLFNWYQIKSIFNLKNYKIIKKEKDIIEIIEIKTKYKYIITIHEIIWELDIPINFEKTHQKHNSLKLSEDDVKKQVINNINKYISAEIININTEYVIDDWRLDILLLDKNWIYHIIELKKKETDLNTIDQCMRYWNFFDDIWITNKLYVLWIKNNETNKEYALKNNVKILEF